MTDLLGKYGSAVPLESIVTLAKTREGPVRLAALKALGAIGREKDQSELIALLLRSEAEAERSAAQRSLASVCSRIPDPEKRADKLLEAYATANAEGRGLLLRTMGRVGGGRALATVAGETQSQSADLRDAAVRALADWPTIDAFDNLLTVAKSKEQLNLRVLALRGCVRVVESSQLDPVYAARYHEKTLAAAERVDEKRLVLGALANLPTPEALKAVIPYLGNDSLGLDAAMAAGRISAGKAEGGSESGPPPVARAFIEASVSPRVKSQIDRRFGATANLNIPPEGFTPLFNGKDLNGWKGLVENPVARAKMTPTQRATAQLRADSVMRAHWSTADGILLFDGKGESICTAKDYADFEMLVDWRIERNGDSGIYLRGSPQVQIWDPAQWPEGSGGLYNNRKNPSKPLRRADNPVGEWNTFRIRMIGERVTVYLNDVLVVDSVILENYWDRSLPIFPTGQIELQSHNSPLYFRNIFIREIPRRKPLFSGSLFNAVDLKGWTIVGGKEGTWGVGDGILFTTGDGGGWLSTDAEYENFELDLDFRVPEGGNSGIFLRSPRQGDPAYTGMEIQVLDDYAPEYAKLRPWQYCGSIYGVVAPTVRASKKALEWQHCRIIARGPRITIVLNGQTVVDADLVAQMEKESSHPGLKRRSGFIGLQCHSLRVEYRAITLTELEWKEDNDRH
jgi:HEAT repeat protein